MVPWPSRGQPTLLGVHSEGTTSHPHRVRHRKLGHWSHEGCLSVSFKQKGWAVGLRGTPALGQRGSSPQPHRCGGRLRAQGKHCDLLWSKAEGDLCLQGGRKPTYHRERAFLRVSKVGAICPCLLILPQRLSKDRTVVGPERGCYLS